MAQRQGALKRQKERARQEKQRDKEVNRAERRKDKAARPPGETGDAGEDPDIAGIVPGPQPLPAEE